jgi:hypothetical protein
MATYIPNITDTFPDIQPFKPDYDFLMNALQYKQSQYNAGFSQVNDVYSSILNSDLTRPVNQQRRAEFLKAAEDNIKKISSLDLSLPQNVQLASNVFKPFYEDNNIVYDMMYTKKAKQALSEGESYKNCLSDDCKGKYSDVSMQAINYKLKEFQSSDDENARKVSAPEYVPYVNIFTEAEKILGEKFTNISIDEKSGGYMVTTKNGPKAFNVILQQLSSTLGVDPRVKKYAQTQAYVNVMNDVLPLANTKYNGDINQAKAEYFPTIANDLLNNDAAKTLLIQKSLDDVESKIDIYNARLSNGGKLSTKEQLEYQQLTKQKNVYSENLESTNERIRVIRDAYNNNDLSILENAAIQSQASSFISDNLVQASNIQAYKDYQISQKPDEFEMYNWKKKVDWSYTQMEKELDFNYDLKLEKYKKELEGGDYDEFIPQATTTQAGQDINVLKEDREVYNQSWKNYSGAVNSIVTGALNINDPNIKSAVNKMLQSENVKLADLQSGVLSTNKLRAIHGKISDLFTRYPELNSAISTPLKNANDARQMMDATDVTIAKNNKAVVNNLLADKATDEFDKVLLSSMFDKNGRLRNKTAAYNEYVSKYGTKGLEQRMLSGFASAEIEGFKRMFGSKTTAKQYFESLYDDQKEDFDEKYINYAIQNKSYVPAGGIGLGGGGGITTDYVISGVADPKRNKSKQTLALYDITSSLAGSKVALGSPETVRSESEDDFEDIKASDVMQGYVNNLRVNMRVNKNPVAYSYSPLGLGSKKYGTLHIRPSADDKTLKALLDSKAIEEEEYNKVISQGITVVIPKQTISNTYLNQNTSVNNREVILKSTGQYQYYNPKIQADITFKMQDDGMVVPSGTIIDTKTRTLQYIPQNPIDLATFNSMLFGLDNYN